MIYAIEEPETSQHPNYQRIIIESLKKLAQNKGRQILLTTHTPEIARMVNKENIIFIQKDNKDNVGGKIKCRKRKIKCRIFATNYLSFNLKLKL